MYYDADNMYGLLGMLCKRVEQCCLPSNFEGYMYECVFLHPNLSSLLGESLDGAHLHDVHPPVTSFEEELPRLRRRFRLHLPFEA